MTSRLDGSPHTDEAVAQEALNSVERAQQECNALGISMEQAEQRSQLWLASAQKHNGIQLFLTALLSEMTPEQKSKLGLKDTESAEELAQGMTEFMRPAIQSKKLQELSYFTAAKFEALLAIEHIQPAKKVAGIIHYIREGKARKTVDKLHNPH